MAAFAVQDVRNAGREKSKRCKMVRKDCRLDPGGSTAGVGDLKELENSPSVITVPEAAERKCTIPPPRSVSYLKRTLPPEEFAKLKRSLEFTENDPVLEYFAKETSIVNIYDTLQTAAQARPPNELTLAKIGEIPFKEKISLVKVQFSKLIFFFDCDPSAKSAEVAMKYVRDLGAKLVLFMTKNVTHLVTDKIEPVTGNVQNTIDGRLIEPSSVSSWLCPNVQSTQNWAIKYTKSKQSSIEAAIKFEIKVWPLASLSKFLTESFSLNRDPLQKKIHFGHENSNFLSFKDKYLLLECTSNNYTPIYAKEFTSPSSSSLPPWPVLNPQPNSQKSVFAKASHPPKKKPPQPTNPASPRSRPPCSHNSNRLLSQNNTLYPSHGLTSKKATCLTTLNHRELSIFGGRRYQHYRKSSAIANTPLTPSGPRTSASKSEPFQGKSFYSRSGWCEHCGSSYKSYRSHVTSSLHKNIAAKNLNSQRFDELVTIINEHTSRNNSTARQIYDGGTK